VASKRRAWRINISKNQHQQRRAASAKAYQRRGENRQTFGIGVAAAGVYRHNRQPVAARIMA